MSFRVEPHPAGQPCFRRGSFIGGQGLTPDDVDVSGHGPQPDSAPTKASATTSSVPALTGARAATVVAARAATCLAVHAAGAARTPKSLPSRTARTHRRSEDQLAAAVAPTTAQGLMRARTSVDAIADTPNRASANAMADDEKSRLVSTSRGTTVGVAPHFVHRYRRTHVTRSSDRPPTVDGPRTCRLRTPCPCSTTLPPVGLLAALHRGQRDGRTSSAVGLFSSQDLTSSSLRMTSRVPRVVAFLKHSTRGSTRGVFAHAPSHLLPSRRAASVALIASPVLCRQRTSISVCGNNPAH